MNKLLKPVNPNLSLKKEVSLFNNQGFVTKERIMNNIFKDKENKHGFLESMIIIADSSTKIQKEMGFNAKDYMINNEYRAMYKLEKSYH